MAINIQNIIAALEAKVAAATSATETQELIVLIKTIKASGQSIIASYATSSALPTATLANAGNIAFVSDVAKLFYSNGTTWAEVGSGSGSGSGGGTAYNQSLNTTDDVVFNSALIGSIALIDNTLSAIDVYGNLDTLTIASPLEITAADVGPVTTVYPQVNWINFNNMGSPQTLTFNLDANTYSSTERQTIANELIAKYFVSGKTVTTSAIQSQTSYQNEVLKFTVNTATILTDTYNSLSITGILIDLGTTGLLVNGSQFSGSWGSWGTAYQLGLTAQLPVTSVAATVNSTGISTIKPLLVEGDFAANKTVVDNGSGQINFSIPPNAPWASYMVTANVKDQLQFNVTNFSASQQAALLTLPAGSTIFFPSIYLNGWTGPSSKTLTLASTPVLFTDYYGSQYIVFSFVEQDIFGLGGTGPTQATATVDNFFNYTYSKTIVTKLIDVTSDVLSVGGVKVNATTPVNAGALVVGGEVQPQALNVYNKVTTEIATTTGYNMTPGTAGIINYMSINLGFMNGQPHVYYEAYSGNTASAIPSTFAPGSTLRLEFTRYNMMQMKNIKWIVNAVVASTSFSAYGPTGKAGYVYFNTVAPITYSDNGGASYKTGTIYDVQMAIGEQFSSMSVNDMKTTYFKVDTYNPLLVNNSGVLATNVVSDSALIGDVTVVGNTISAVDSYGLPNGNLSVQSNVILEKDVTFGGQVLTSPPGGGGIGGYMKVYTKSMTNLSMTQANWIYISPYNMGPSNYYIEFIFDDTYGNIKNNAEVTAVKSLAVGNTITAGGYYGQQTFTVMAVTITTTSVLVKIDNSANFNFNMGDAVSISYIATTPYYLPLYI